MFRPIGKAALVGVMALGVPIFQNTGLQAEEQVPRPDDGLDKMYQQLMAGGLNKLEHQDWDGAENAYDMALKLKPNDPAARGGLMLAQTKKKEAAAAQPVPAQPPAPPLPPTPEKKPEPVAEKKPEPAPAPVAEKKPEPVPPPEVVKVQEPPKKVEVKDVPKQLELPDPIKLAIDEWEKGSGSSCYWSGTRLYLAEGDEMYHLPIRGDFAVQFQIEADMQQSSMIYIDVRPDGKKAAIIRGYGSKEGSPPFLAVGKQTVAKAKKQPGLEQMTLGFRRTGKQIEFFFNSENVGETWDTPEGAVLWLWVGGKGIVDKFSIVKK